MQFKINKHRLIYLAFGAATFLIAYSVGSALPLSEQESEMLIQEFSRQIGNIDQNGIFLNNIRLTLIMFIPAVGSAFGAFSGFGTGLVFNALASSTPMLREVSPLAILMTPFGIMEVFVYGLAISRSAMLIYFLLKRIPWSKYLIPTLIEVGIATVVLFIAAVVEWQMIERLGGLDSRLALDPMES
ncbi:MAG: stage II sporulation protein M [Thermoproteota archaeon]|nr:stage II sporulation protein M [Thermoproteota archaeon]